MSNEELVALYQRGSSDALNKLCAQNKGFIHKLAKKYSNGDDFLEEDLSQEGYLGLIKAAGLYNESSGAAFITYAAFWIKQAIFQYKDERTGIIRLGGSARNSLREIGKAEKEFYDLAGRAPTDHELAEVLGASVQSVKRRRELRKMTDVRSLEEPAEGSEDATIGDAIPGGSDPAERILDTLEKEQLSKEIREAIEALTDEQKIAIYGVFWRGMNCRSCGRSAYITAIKKLRRRLADNELVKSYYGEHLKI